MNDDIRKMLADAGRSAASVNFEKEMNTLSRFADENVPIICKDVYRRLIVSYQKDPLASNPATTYDTIIKFKRWNLSKFERIQFNNQLGDLAEAYSKRNTDIIVFYETSDNQLSSKPFKLKKLIAELVKDGIEITEEYSDLYIRINASKFRAMINSPNNTRTK